MFKDQSGNVTVYSSNEELFQNFKGEGIKSTGKETRIHLTDNEKMQITKTISKAAKKTQDAVHEDKESQAEVRYPQPNQAKIGDCNFLVTTHEAPNQTEELVQMPIPETVQRPLLEPTAIPKPIPQTDVTPEEPPSTSPDHDLNDSFLEENPMPKLPFEFGISPLKSLLTNKPPSPKKVKTVAANRYVARRQQSKGTNNTCQVCGTIYVASYDRGQGSWMGCDSCKGGWVHARCLGFDPRVTDLKKVRYQCVACARK